MFFGSSGFGVSPSAALGWRYSPELSAAAVAAEKSLYCAGGSGESGAEARRTWARARARLGC